MYCIIIVIIGDILLGILDYNLLHSFYKDPQTQSIIACLFFLPVFLVFLFLDFQFTNILAISVWILSWFLIFISAYLYSLSYAAKIPPGTVLGIYKIQMVFAFIVWVMFLGETLSDMQLLGHGIIFLGAILLSVDHIGKLKKPSLLIIPFIGALVMSVAVIINDIAYSHLHFWTVFWSFAFWWFLWAPIIIFGTKEWKKFRENINLNWRKYLIVGWSVELVNIVITIAAHLALKFWPLSLVVFLKETYVAFLVLISMIFGYYYPKYFPDGGKKISIKKLTIISVMMLWVYFALS